MCTDPRFTKIAYLYQGPDAGSVFFQKIFEEEQKCLEIFEKYFNEPMALMPEDEKNFEQGTLCHICAGDKFSDKDYKI